MSTYKRWFPVLLAVDGTTRVPRFALGARHQHRQDEKRQEQAELHAWEGEGGNPEPRNVALHPSLFADGPRGDIEHAMLQKRAAEDPNQR